MTNKANETRWGQRVLLGGAVVLAGAGMLFGRFVQAAQEQKPADGSAQAPARLLIDNSPPKRESSPMAGFSAVVKKVAPNVVNVFTSTRAKNVAAPSSPFFNDPMFRRFFGEEAEDGPRQRRMPRQNGLGSGVVVTEDGYILTNNHVIENADDVRVAFTDGREFAAKVVGRDPKTDIAVLKIEARGLTPVALANSDALEVGDLVLAIGNPFNVGQTVTMGIVSATGRASLGLDYEDFIQTDAAINPGNSGGALVDAEGRLVGINTAILSRTGGNQGIGFAVPANLASSVMQSLIRDGRVVRGFMGVNIQDVTPALAREFGLKENSGAVVADITPRSPADKAGLKAGDVIIAFNGKPVRDSRQLKLQVAQVAPGKRVPVEVRRDGGARTLEVQLKEFPGDQEIARQDRGAGEATDALNGVAVTDVDPARRGELRLPAQTRGALVADVEENSAAFAAGLRPGDVILEINRKPVTNADEAVKLSEKARDGRALLRIWSRGGSRFLVVEENKVG